MFPVSYEKRSPKSFLPHQSNSQNHNRRRHSICNINSEKSTRTTDETLFETLMSDPLKKAFLLNMLSQEKENIAKYKQKNQMKTPIKKHQRDYCESPTALLRRRALQKKRDSDSTSTSSRSSPSSFTLADPGEILQGVVAYVEIRSKDTDRSAGAKLLMQSMGATIVDTLNRKVTHVVFKDGSFSTYQKAKLLKVHLVSVLWLEAIRKSNSRVPEHQYPALGTETYDVNVTEIYQDYENVVQDEVRRSLAVGSRRNTMRSQRQGRLTALPYELNSSQYSTFSCNNQTAGRPSDIIQSSQINETESIIALRSNIAIRPNSATFGGNDSEDVEITSDADSDCGVINGQSFSHSKNSLLSDLDVQIGHSILQNKDDSSTKNQTANTSSSRSASLLSRKSCGSTKTTCTSVAMDLTNISALELDNHIHVNSRRRKTIGANNDLNTNRLTLEKERLSQPGEKNNVLNLRSPYILLTNISPRNSKNSETMSSLRISADSASAQGGQQLNLPSPHILLTNISPRNSKNSETMPSLRISADSASLQGGQQSGIRKSARLNKSNTNNSLHSESMPELRISTDSEIRINEENLEAAKNSEKRPIEEPTGPNKRLRKLYNLNQSISKTMEYVTESQPNTNLTPVVPLSRIVLTNSGKTQSNKRKDIIVGPIKVKKKKRQAASKKIKKVVKSAKKVIANTENDEQKALAAEHLEKNRDKSQNQPVSQLNLHLENNEETTTTQLDEVSNKTPSQAVSDRRKSMRIKNTLLNRRSTLEFVETASQQPTTQRSQKLRKNKSSIVCTRMHKPDVQMFIQIVKKLGVYFIEDEVSKKTTHLVAGESKRTINLLRAISRGCWIVTQEWLLKSLEAGKWLAEEDYELTDFSPAIQQCRTERQVFGNLYSMDIFSDCGLIFVSHNSDPRRSDLEELVVLCKGTIVKTIRHAKIVVGDWVRYDGVACVSEKWILDSITNNKKKSFKKYFITYRT